MRKIFLIIAVLWLTSCDSMLDVKPENAVTFTNFFETEQDLNTINVQMHSFLKNMGSVDNMHVTMGLLADRYSTSTWENMKKLIPSAIVDNALTNWKKHYDVIHFANLILDNIHRVTGLSQDRRGFYLGQAYFVKGFTYFDLARRWGNAVITKNSVSQEALTNSTVMEVLDEAIRNGELAEKVLGKYEDLVDLSGAPLTTKQYGSKGAASALLAHAYAWKGSIIDLYGFEGDSKKCYEVSTKWATQLIDKKGGNYSLEQTTEDLCKNTMTGDGCESIFVLELDEYSTTFPNTQSPGKYYVTWPINIYKTESDVWAKTLSINSSRVQGLYEKGDARRESFFFKLDSMAHDTLYDKTHGYAYVYKWREALFKTTPTGMTLMQTVYADYVVWRLADIYLLRAECYAKLNDPRAKDDLNEIRKRAKVAGFPAPGDGDISYAIFKEREKELIFEGHRYYDAIRSNCFVELDPAYKELTKQDIIDGALYLPIYKSAFEMNDVLRQNAYWFKYFN